MQLRTGASGDFAHFDQKSDPLTVMCDRDIICLSESSQTMVTDSKYSVCPHISTFASLLSEKISNCCGCNVIFKIKGNDHFYLFFPFSLKHIKKIRVCFFRDLYHPEMFP